MKVSHMRKGHLYKIPNTCRIHLEYFQSGHYGINDEEEVLNSRIAVMRIHKDKNLQKTRFCWYPENDIKLLLYLGHQIDKWKLYGIKKHHYFLYDKKSIIIDNYCMKTLEEIDDGEI